MKKIIHLMVFLAVISAVAGGALAYANKITAPIILDNQLKQEKQSLQAMYPDAKLDDFKEVDITSLDSKTVSKVYAYQDVLIFKMDVNGYKDGTTFLVSIKTDDKTIDKYYPISNGDTKGLGSKVMEEPFINSLEGKDATSQLDTISGATIPSSAVVNGINEASGYVYQLKGE